MKLKKEKANFSCYGELGYIIKELRELRKSFKWKDIFRRK